jgi:thiamine biosynthesis protein ThiI
MSTPLTEPDLLLVRYSELGLKGGNRARFEGALVQNLREALEALGAVEIRRAWGRVVIRPERRRRQALRIVARTFGVKSVSPAWRLEPTVEGLGALGRALLDEHLPVPRGAAPAHAPGAVRPSFRVRVKRADKAFPLTSEELERQVADAMLADEERVRVDLRAAELEYGIEVRAEGTFAFLERVPGPGGLPVGTLGRGLCLLSGGIDSPVAAWLAMKRGLRVGFVTFHSPPFLGEGSRRKVEDLARVLAGWQGPSRLHEVPFTAIQVAIREGAPAGLRTILYRRSMARIATRLGQDEGAEALVTGESLGQVASQTLTNLAAIEAAAGLPILRPLVTADKEESIALARRIGTFPVSTQPEPDCCTVFQPRRPALASDPEVCARVEAELDLDALETQALEVLETRRVLP